jgi:hypothetical protein
MRKYVFLALAFVLITSAGVAVTSTTTGCVASCGNVEITATGDQVHGYGWFKINGGFGVTCTSGTGSGCPYTVHMVVYQQQSDGTQEDYLDMYLGYDLDGDNGNDSTFLVNCGTNGAVITYSYPPELFQPGYVYWIYIDVYNGSYYDVIEGIESTTICDQYLRLQVPRRTNG